MPAYPDDKPTLARRDADPAVKDAWGNVTGARVVGREALVEAEVIPDRKRPPLTREQLIKRGVLLACLALVAFVGVWKWMGHRTLQKRHALLEALQRRHHRILVLDAEHVIVACNRQRGAKLRPPFLAMAVAKGDVVPGALAKLIARHGLENAVGRRDRRVEARILGMDMIDRIAERADRHDGISPHPHEMARIEVRAHRLSHGIAQVHQCPHVIDVLEPMQLQA